MSATSSRIACYRSARGSGMKWLMVDIGMGHSACPEEMDDVEDFILARLPASRDRIF